MNKQLKNIANLKDIFKAANYCIKFVDGMTYEDFAKDPKTFFAINHQIMIIGEATKRLTPEFKKNYPEIQWKEMAGMRDILIHSYDDVDDWRIWEVTQNLAPKLVGDIEKNIIELNGDVFDGRN